MTRPPFVIGLFALILSILWASAQAAEPLYLEGYCSPLSVREDDEVAFHVSTNAAEFSTRRG